jgi:hypothetical protein
MKRTAELIGFLGLTSARRCRHAVAGGQRLDMDCLASGPRVLLLDERSRMAAATRASAT